LDTELPLRGLIPSPTNTDMPGEQRGVDTDQQDLGSTPNRSTVALSSADRR